VDETLNRDRDRLRWNGWGWVDAPDPFAGRDAAWDWLASEFGVASLPVTPPKLLRDITLPPIALSETALAALRAAVGEAGLKTDDYERAFHARGQSYADLLALRAGDLGVCPDAVVYPENEDAIARVLATAVDHGFAVVPYGGGSSVVGGVNAIGRSGGSDDERAGVVTLDTTRLARMLEVDEVALTATAEAGIYGPSLEAALGERGFTLGHFPQSFEFSTLGGWIAHHGAGQNSALYGRADAWMISARIVTPKGVWQTESFPRSAAGANLNQLLLGSEGQLGVITRVTFRIRRKPEAQDYRGFLFKTFEAGVDAARTMLQADAPAAMVRLSDVAETRFFRMGAAVGKEDDAGAQWKARLETSVLRMNGVADNPCVMIIGQEGERRTVKRNAARTARIARSFGAFSLGRKMGDRWQAHRFAGPYQRDPMLDHGVGVDTLETATRWSNIAHLRSAVLTALEKTMRETAPQSGQRGRAMCHISHAYRDGASLYFTYLFPRDLNGDMEQWRAIKTAASDAIVANGGTISHHHGVGVDHKSWFGAEKGPIGLDVLRAVRRELDPEGVLNPGKLTD